MRIATSQIIVNDFVDYRTPIAISLGKTFTVHIPEFLIMGIQ